MLKFKWPIFSSVPGEQRAHFSARQGVVSQNAWGTHTVALEGCKFLMELVLCYLSVPSRTRPSPGRCFPGLQEGDVRRTDRLVPHMEGRLVVREA